MGIVQVGNSIWHPRLDQLFGIDLRSLAAFRIGAASLLLIDVALRSRELLAHYTDQGILPRAARIELWQAGEPFGMTHMWSLHLASGEPWFIALLMLLASAAAVCLLVGYHTRAAAVCSWLLLVSIGSRNPLLLNSGDVLLRCMLFWSLFLPLGARWSIDATRGGAVRPRQAARVTSVASLALLLQLVMVYFFSALFKLHPAWLSEASGVYYALNCDAYCTPFGVWLRQFEWLLPWVTWATFGLELAGPLLAFSPVATARIRSVLIPLFWLFHLGLALTLTVGLFVPICLVAWLVFVPSHWWERLARRWPALSDRHNSLAPHDSPVAETEADELASRRRVHRWTGAGGQLLVAALLLYTVLWNVRELDVRRWAPHLLPLRFNGPARALGLDQNWSMFSPVARTEDGWLVMRGVLRNGQEVNLWRPGQPLPWEKPPLVSATFKAQRWRKYLDNLTTEQHAVHRMYFCNWLQRRWNSRYANGDPQQEVVEVQLIHRIELTPPPGRPIPDAEDRILWTWYYE